MGDIRIAIAQMAEPQKSLYTTLLEYYEYMKKLEKDEARGGKQATLIVMTVNDIEDIFKKLAPTEEQAAEKSIEFEDGSGANKFLQGAMWMKLEILGHTLRKYEI